MCEKIKKIRKGQNHFAIEPKREPSAQTIAKQL